MDKIIVENLIMRAVFDVLIGTGIMLSRSDSINKIFVSADDLK